MQRMHGSVGDCIACSRQCLTKHLPAKHLRRADVAAFATKDIVFDALEFEQVEQVGEDRIHRSLRFSLAIRLDVSQRLPPMPSMSA